MREVLVAAQPLIELAVAEDIGPGDATSEVAHCNRTSRGCHYRDDSKGTALI